MSTDHKAVPYLVFSTLSLSSNKMSGHRKLPSLVIAQHLIRYTKSVIS